MSEPADAPPSRGGARAIAADARLALSFLTVLPVGPPPGAGDLRRAAVWWPLAGALVGAVAGGVRAAALPALGPTAASAIAVVALVALTGALHLDGLADSADAMGSRSGRARRLEIMRDPATGVFGAFAVVAWALLMVVALAPLSAADGLRSLLAAGLLSRSAILLHARVLAPARRDGLGAAFAPAPVALAAAGLAPLAVLPLCGLVPGATAVAAALVVTALGALWASRLLGGRTGDTLGAAAALAEVAVCLSLLGFWRP